MLRRRTFLGGGSAATLVPFSGAWGAGQGSDRLLASFSDLAGLTYAQVSAGTIARVRGIAGHYVVAAPDASCADLDYTDAGGVRFQILPGPQGYDVRAFGAVGDGDLKAGTGTDDTAALQAAADAAAGTALHIPGGTYRTSDYIRLSSNTRVQVDGTLWNDRGTLVPYDQSNNHRSPFLLGSMALAVFGQEVGGVPDHDTAYCEVYGTSSAVSPQMTFVTLETASDAGDFTPGDFVILRSSEYRVQSSTSVDLILPDNSSILKVVAADADTGTLTFEHRIGFVTATPPLVCRFTGAREAGTWGEVFHVVENVHIIGGHYVGRTAFGNNNTGAYKCSMRGFTFDTHHMIQANGFAHCVVENATGRFVERLVETKFCAHDSRISGITARDRGPGSSGPALFSVGEGARSIRVTNFEVQAPNRTGGHLFQLQPGTDCVFESGWVNAPGSANVPVYFYADSNVPLLRCGLREVQIEHAGPAHGVFQDGPYEAQHCFLQDVTFVGHGKIAVGISFAGGQNNQVVNCRLTGKISFALGAEGNLFADNITDTTRADGWGRWRNRVARNTSVEGPRTVTGP